MRRCASCSPLMPGVDVPTVFYVTQDSPASDAGLRVGDIITAIDGKPSSTLTLDSIREMLKQNGH
ncbi:MAG TPA: PDZ domain-containing protein, partial [Pyrinomonadaceae bacterium]|nr:PDZ domain-containing protein [Pyrinomonadaceae bacterium]